MIETAAKRGATGEKELLEDLARRMAMKATPEVISRGQNHWISRILDTTSTYGGNIDR